MKLSDRKLSEMQSTIKLFLIETEIKLPAEYGPYMHHIWFKVYANVKYNATNPNVIKNNGTRILPYNPNYELYPEDTNDNTLNTALKRIHKNLTSN